MGVDPEEQVAVLQARIHDRLADLRAISQGVRVGPDPQEEQLEPDAEDPADEVHEIDLTDGIDLTDARLVEAGVGDEDDWPDGDGAYEDNPAQDDDLRHAESGDLLEGGSRHHRRPRHGVSGDSGPRLLHDRAGEETPDPRPSLQDATDAVIEATRELISYERRLPLLLDAGPRRQSLLIVRWSGLVVAAVALSLLAGPLVTELPRWWVLPGIAGAGAAWLLLRMPVHPPGDRHQTLRPGAVVVAAGALLTAFCAAAHLPAFVVFLGMVAMAAGIWHAQQTPVRIGALPRRFR
ncbi:hypothetical protein [Kineosporia mesophila]|nr:hypothetical protein [Kineosporia mesophila]MCD5350421.1 hypothetical protein [Kineosporia mesophila]